MASSTITLWTGLFPTVFCQGRIFCDNVTEIFHMTHPKVSSGVIRLVQNFGPTCKISDSCRYRGCETCCFLEFLMTTFSIIVVTVFFIGLENACSLVHCRDNEIITSTALIKDTCDFIQPMKSCLSLNFLHAKTISCMGEKKFSAISHRQCCLRSKQGLISLNRAMLLRRRRAQKLPIVHQKIPWWKVHLKCPLKVTHTKLAPRNPNPHQKQLNGISAISG